MVIACPITTSADEALAIHQELIEAERALRAARANPSIPFDQWQAACTRHTSALAAVLQLRSDEAEAA